MTTIANLVIAASLDPTGVRSGLDASLGYLQGYATVATQALKKATADAAVQADATAVTYLKGLNDSFRAGQAALKINLFNGAMSQEEYEAHGAQNAIAYNAALSAGIAKFTANGFALKDVYPLVDSFKRTGVEASTAIVAASSNGLQGLSRIRLGLTSLLAQFTGTIPVLDRVGSQLLLFGTGGNVALAVIAGLAAIAGAWHYATTEAREHTKAVEEGTKALKEWYKTEQQGPAGKLGSDLDAAQETLANLRKQQADLLRESRGTAFGEAGIVQQRNAAGMIPETKRQYDDLAKQIQEAETRISEIMRKATQERIDAQEKDLAEIVRTHHATAEQLNLTRNLIAAYDQQIRDFRGSNKPDDMDALAKAITGRQSLVDALNPKKDAEAADKAWRTHIDTIRAVVDAYSTLASEHVLTSAAGLKLLTTYEAVNSELARSTDLTTKHAAELLKLRAEMERTEMLSAIRGPVPAIQATASGAQALAGRPEDALAAATQLVERARLLTEAGQQTTQAYRDTITALRIVDGYLTAANQHEGLTNDRLREQLAIRQALAGLTSPITQTPFMVELTEQATRAQQMITLAEAARRAGASNAAELERAANVQRDRAVSLIRIAVEQSADWNNLTAQQRTQLEQIMTLLGGITPATSDIAKGYSGIATALHGVLDAASGLGSIPRALRDGVSAAEHLLTSVKAIQAAKASADKAGGNGWDMATILGAAGGVVGAIGASVSIISTFASIFQENNTAVRDNTAKLSEMREALEAQKGISGTEAMADALHAFITGPASSHGIGYLPLQTDELAKDLKAAGLTLEQFTAKAKELGITLSSGQTFVQFYQALQLAVQAAGKFSQSLDDQRSLITLHNKVFGLTSPADQINEELTLLAKFAPALRAQIGDIDVTTAEGQAKLKAALEALVTAIENNAVSVADLGTLAGVKDLAQIIDTLSGGLSSLTNATTAAAQSINNVEWYRLNQAVYDVAGLAGAGGGAAVNTPMQLPATGPKPNDTTPFLPVSGGAQLTLTGDVILQLPDADPETLRRSVLTAFQRKSFNQFGTTQRWSEVQE